MIGTSSLLITAAALASLLVVEETGPAEEGGLGLAGDRAVSVERRKDVDQAGLDDDQWLLRRQLCLSKFAAGNLP
ncbi:MAG TPA: hypothetical protein VD834_06010 [Blastococcus sp.]|nr:hypothetical protein [Blastococcus sp.]